MKFSNTLITWYLQHKRPLPWRSTKDPYRIWLSEIILQQTRVEQGTPYYHAFLDAFPTVQALAAADQDEVLKLWQGLGYYSRARNMHATAQYITDTLNGQFPNSYTELKKLKGVGDYTASAIASIAFNESAAVVDGNVYRALSRIFGIDTPIDSSPGQREFKALAQELIDPQQPATFNQALMEFGGSAMQTQKSVLFALSFCGGLCGLSQRNH
ncbi:A/G-specific adenine glycosylase [Croceiramulus getboli]